MLFNVDQLEMVNIQEQLRGRCYGQNGDKPGQHNHEHRGGCFYERKGAYYPGHARWKNGVTWLTSSKSSDPLGQGCNRKCVC